LLYFYDESIPTPMNRPDDALGPAIVSDDSARRFEPTGQRGLTHEPIVPNLIEELPFGHDPVVVPHQIGEHIEHLGLNLLSLASPAQLEDPEVELTVFKPVDHQRIRIDCTTLRRSVATANLHIIST
jgi:hypothetical protein